MATISVRPVNHETDRRELMSLLQANLPDLPHERRFDWLYRANPDGPACSWFVCEPSGRAVGVTSVFPRSMWIKDQVEMCGQVGDFAIVAGHRSLGPALLLQRASFQPVQSGELTFCYDCPPHQAGMSTFRRLGMQPNCRMDRYAIPLRVDQRLRDTLGPASAIPAAAGNLLLRLARRLRSKRVTSIEVGEFSGMFGEEFSRLDQAARGADGIRGQRSADLLNWRYRQDPLQSYEVLTARCNGELKGFVALRVASRVVTIVDLFAASLAEGALALLASVVERYERSHQTLEATSAAGSGLVAILSAAGFRRRSEAAHVVAYARPESQMAALLRTGFAWSFQQSELRV
jgi:hypothetical protein